MTKQENDNFKKVASWAKILEKIIANITPDTANACADFCLTVARFNIGMMQGLREKALLPKYTELLKNIKPVVEGNIREFAPAKDNYEQLLAWTKILDEIIENLDISIFESCKVFFAAIIKNCITKMQSDSERDLASKFKDIIEKIEGYKPIVHFSTSRRVSVSDKATALDDPRHEQSVIITQKLYYMRYCASRVRHVFNLSDEAYEHARCIYEAFTPKSIVGVGKIRIGGLGDGGYVMPDLDYADRKDKIAYSFGVSDYSPWDMQMAKMGYDVFQYDGTIAVPPEEHPRMHYYRYNISAQPDPPQNERNIRQIIFEHGHSDKNIILQCDIEGAEWEMFAAMNDEEILRFDQIIVEFHYIADLNNFDYHLDILEKINRTHQAVHIHCNNYGASVILHGFRLLPDVWEVTYVRKTDWEFIDCNETFPGQYDTPNNQMHADIFLGKFSDIKNDKKQKPTIGISPEMMRKLVEQDKNNSNIMVYSADGGDKIDKIPKILHYCWLSNNEWDDDHKKCFETWDVLRRQGWEFKLWNLDNFDINRFTWTKTSFNARHYAFTADFIRLWSLYNYGGWYMDLDVKLIKPFTDEILNTDLCVCWDHNQTRIRGIGGIEAGSFGAAPGNLCIKRIIEWMKDKDCANPGMIYPPVEKVANWVALPFVMTALWLPELQNGKIKPLPMEYFCSRSRGGIPRESLVDNITENTFTNHRFPNSGYSWSK